MRFESPLLLWSAPILGALVAWLAWRARNRRWTGAAAWSRTLGETARRHGRYTPLVLGLVALLSGVALAGPRWGEQLRDTESRALNVIVVMDISKSMLAQDVSPNRLLRAAGHARRLVHDLAGDRLGLVVFAARGYQLVPLTLDESAVTLQLDALDPEIASEGGSGMASALALSTRLLTANPLSGDQVVVMLTDGESFDGEAALQAAGEALRDAGIFLVTIPIGSTEGARIPIDGRFHRNVDGEVVVTSRRDDLLTLVTKAAGGVMIPADAGDPAGEVRRTLSQLNRAKVTDRLASDLVPRGWLWALAAGLLLLGHAMTRRTASLVGLLLCAGVATLPAQRPTTGTQLLRRGDTTQAGNAFLQGAKQRGNDTAWYNAGTAALRAGDPAAAIDALERATLSLDPGLRQRALYNLGTARLLQANQSPEGKDSTLRDAIQRLQGALSLNPRDSQAKYNYELARLLLPPPPPPQPQQQSPQPPPPPPPPGEGQGEQRMSQAEAEQVLNAMERAERATLQAMNSRNRRAAPPLGPDW